MRNSGSKASNYQLKVASWFVRKTSLQYEHRWNWVNFAKIDSFSRKWGQIVGNYQTIRIRKLNL